MLKIVSSVFSALNKNHNYLGARLLSDMAELVWFFNFLI